jgi:hypothetical protein
MGVTEAVGIQLSSLGFTGAEDINLSATLRPISGIGNANEAGIFVGTSSTEMIRAGQITFNGQAARFSTNTVGGDDVDSHYFGFGLNAADGLTISISRTGGDWDCLIDGVRWLPNTAFNGSGAVAPPLFLNAATDLTVVVYATNRSNLIPATYVLDNFSAAISTECDDCCYYCGGTTLGDFQLVSDHFYDHVLAGTSGDLTVDGIVSFDDFRFWKADYNRGAGASPAVPEPATLAMLVLGTLSMNSFAARQRRRRTVRRIGDAALLWAGCSWPISLGLAGVGVCQV